MGTFPSYPTCPEAQMPPRIQVWNHQQTFWLITRALTLITMAESLSSLQQRKVNCQKDAQMASGKNNQANCKSPGDELEYFCRGETSKDEKRDANCARWIISNRFPSEKKWMFKVNAHFQCCVFNVYWNNFLFILLLWSYLNPWTLIKNQKVNK